MKNYFKRGMSTTWFYETPRIIDAFKITFFQRSKEKHFLFYDKPFYSKRLDLAQPEEIIFKSFNATTRTEIRQAEKLELKVVSNVKQDIVLQIWKKMILEKQLPWDHNDLEKYSDEIQFATAIYNSKNELLVAHNYFIVNETVFLQTSASVFRFFSSEQKKLVSRANRLLIWRDIQIFKKEYNLKYYDIGGYSMDSKDSEKLKINSFKDCFFGKNGDLICYHDLTSYPYLLADFILKCLEKCLLLFKRVNR